MKNNQRNKLVLEIIRDFLTIIKLLVEYIEKREQRKSCDSETWDPKKHPKDKKGRFKKKGSSETGSKEEKKTLANNAPRPKKWGKPNSDFIGDPTGAINFLLKNKGGYVPEATYKEGIGYIDFVWGNTDWGLAHIIAERDKQELDGIEVIKKIPTIIEKGEIKQGKKKRTVIRYQVSEKEGHEVVITKTDGINWVLTGYQLYSTLSQEAFKKAIEGKKGNK